MAKPRLKLVEPTLPEQLEAAVAVAAAAHETLESAEALFRKHYPDDHRLLMGEVLGMTLVDAERDLRDPNAPVQSKRIEFLKEREKVADLQREAREADIAVDLLRARVEAAITEDERRVALAAAIDEAAKADEVLQKLRGTVARADGAVADAQERHGDAAKAVTAATEAQAKTFEAAIDQGFSPGRDTAVRDARRLADDAADELAVAKTGATTMKAKLGNAEQRVRDARSAVVACAGNVAVAGLPKLLAETQRMQSELEERRLILSLLNGFDPRSQNGVAFRSEIDDFLEAPVLPYTWNRGRVEDHPVVTPWLEALEALRVDADAPLPTN
jgi:hypothetical protein